MNAHTYTKRERDNFTKMLTLIYLKLHNEHQHRGTMSNILYALLNFQAFI